MLTYDVTESITRETPEVHIYLYADDMALASGSKQQLQKAVDMLSEWAEENEMYVNEKKTELVVFRKGGKLAGSDYITYRGQRLPASNSFKYLRINIQMTGT